MAKLKIAFVFDTENEGLTGQCYTNNVYRFFMRGLLKNDRIEMTCIPTEQKFDCLQLAGFDIILFYDIRKTIYKNIHKIGGVRIARSPDSHDIDKQWIELCRTLDIKHCFNHQSSKYARKFLPSDVAYYQIIFGITEGLHRNPNFESRKKDVILLPGISNRRKYYVLREKCKGLSYVEHKTRLDGYTGDRFPMLLAKYRAAIAACSVCSVYKYFEIPACGCLSFMEVNPDNGCDELGFVDNVNAVFINEDNYAEKFSRFLHSVDDPRWKSIAESGREFILEKYCNSVQVNKLINLMETLI